MEAQELLSSWIQDCYSMHMYMTGRFQQNNSVVLRSFHFYFIDDSRNRATVIYRIIMAILEH